MNGITLVGFAFIVALLAVGLRRPARMDPPARSEVVPLDERLRRRVEAARRIHHY
jgi:hypothetical protein